MRILIADDHAVVRRGLREILAETFPNAQFAEVANGDGVMKQLGDFRYRVLVLDVNMPGRSGLDVLREVKRTHPHLPVVMLSVQPEDQYALRCLRAGAAAYVNKDSASEELVLAINKVISGGRYVSAGLAERLLSTFDEGVERPVHESLSDREHEVMRMIASGQSLLEIADSLHVSAKTVSTYRSRIMGKMQMTSNAELVRYALDLKLID